MDDALSLPLGEWTSSPLSGDSYNLPLFAYAPDWLTVLSLIALLGTSLLASSFAPENRRTALTLGILFLTTSLALALNATSRLYDSIHLISSTESESGITPIALLDDIAPQLLLIFLILGLLFLWSGIMLCFFYKKAVRKIWKAQR